MVPGQLVFRFDFDFDIKIKHARELGNALILVIRKRDEIRILHSDTPLRKDDSVRACGYSEDE